MRTRERLGAGIGLALIGLAVASWADPGRYEFDDPVPLPFGGTNAGFGLADVNGDGTQDFVALAFDNSEIPGRYELRIRESDGFGGFGEIRTIATPTIVSPRGIAEIPPTTGSRSRVLLVGTDPQIVEFDATGTPSFTALPRPVDHTGAWTAVADLNGDGRADLVSTRLGFIDPQAILVWLQEADGSFRFLPPQTFENGQSQSYVSVGDFDGDRNADVLIVPVSQATNEPLAQVWFGKGDGTFEQGDAAPPTAGSSPALTVGDLNGDGRSDVTDARNVFLGQSDRSFRAVTDVTQALRNSASRLADIDGDQVLDLVTQYDIYCGLGDGTFGPPTTSPLRRNVGWAYLLGLVADVTGDGRPDIVATDSVAEMRLQVFRQEGLPPPTVLAVDVPELTTHGIQQIRLTGTGFRSGVNVVSLGALIVHAVVRESETSLLVTIEVPPGIGVDTQSLMIVNPDARSHRLDFSVRGLFVRNPRGRLVDRVAPGRDKVKLKAEIEFTRLSARGQFADVRDGLRLEFGNPADPYVLDVPSDPERWTLRGPTVPGKFVYRSGPNEFPRLKIVVDTERGRLKVIAKDLDLPGDPSDEILLRARLAGEVGERTETFFTKTKRDGSRRVLRRR